MLCFSEEINKSVRSDNSDRIFCAQILICHRFVIGRLIKSLNENIVRKGFDYEEESIEHHPDYSDDVSLRYERIGVSKL